MKLFLCKIVLNELASDYHQSKLKVFLKGYGEQSTLRDDKPFVCGDTLYFYMPPGEFYVGTRLNKHTNYGNYFTAISNDSIILNWNANEIFNSLDVKKTFIEQQQPNDTFQLVMLHDNPHWFEEYDTLTIYKKENDLVYDFSIWEKQISPRTGETTYGKKEILKHRKFTDEQREAFLEIEQKIIDFRETPSNNKYSSSCASGFVFFKFSLNNYQHGFFNGNCDYRYWNKIKSIFW